MRRVNSRSFVTNCVNGGCNAGVFIGFTHITAMEAVEIVVSVVRRAEIRKDDATVDPFCIPYRSAG
jgi:hypothetical protein